MKELSTKQRELTRQLNQYRDEYYNKNTPSVSDSVYDWLLRIFTDWMNTGMKLFVWTASEKSRGKSCGMRLKRAATPLLNDI